MASPRTALVAWLALWTCAFAHAQEERDRLESLLTFHHAEAAVPLRLHLRARPRSIEGLLACRIVQGTATLAAIEIPEHLLGDRATTTAVVLPPFAEYWNPAAPVEVVASFAPAGGEAVELARLEIGVVPPHPRTPMTNYAWTVELCVLGLRTPLARSDSEDQARLRALLGMTGTDELGRTIPLQNARLTLVSHLMLADSEALPTTALALGGVDLLELAGPGAAALRVDQVAAIGRWVRTGGALCVIAHPDYTGRPIADLIESLAGPARKPTLLQDGPLEGRLWNVDLGRVAYLTNEGEVEKPAVLDYLVVGREPFHAKFNDPRRANPLEPALDEGVDREQLVQLARALASSTGRSEASIAAQVALVVVFLALAAYLVGFRLRRTRRRLVWPALFALSAIAAIGARAVAGWSYGELARSRRLAFEVVSSSGELLRRWELVVEFPVDGGSRDDPATGPVVILDLHPNPTSPSLAPAPGVIHSGSPTTSRVSRIERHPWAPIELHRSQVGGTPTPGVDWTAILAEPIEPILDYGLTEERLLEVRAQIRRALPRAGVFTAVTYRGTLMIEPWSRAETLQPEPWSRAFLDTDILRQLELIVQRLRHAPRLGPPAPRTAEAPAITPDLATVVLLAVWTDEAGVVAQCRLTQTPRHPRPLDR